MDISAIRSGDVIEIRGRDMAIVRRKHKAINEMQFHVVYINDPFTTWAVDYRNVTKHWKLQGRRRGRPARSEGITVEPDRAQPPGIEKENPFISDDHGMIAS